jgi:hypothetical protein
MGNPKTDLKEAGTFGLPGLSQETRAECDICVENETRTLRRISPTVAEERCSLSSHSEPSQCNPCRAKTP